MLNFDYSYCKYSFLGHYSMLVQCSLKLTFPLFLLEYNPHEELNIDKAMIPYKDYLFIKQCIKDKPVKWDITMFALANASGLCSHVILIIEWIGIKIPQGACAHAHTHTHTQTITIDIITLPCDVLVHACNE